MEGDERCPPVDGFILNIDIARRRARALSVLCRERIQADQHRSLYRPPRGWRCVVRERERDGALEYPPSCLAEPRVSMRCISGRTVSTSSTTCDTSHVPQSPPLKRLREAEQTHHRCRSVHCEGPAPARTARGTRARCGVPPRPSRRQLQRRRDCRRGMELSVTPAAGAPVVAPRAGSVHRRSTTTPRGARWRLCVGVPFRISCCVHHLLQACTCGWCARRTARARCAWSRLA